MEEKKKIIINVSGHNFVTSRSTLLRYSGTRLGKLASANEVVLEFEGDTEIFREILKFYATDKLHCPKNVCFDDFKTNLDFWEIDCEYIAECCAGDMHEEMSLHRQFAFFDKKIKPEAGYEKSAARRLQWRVWSFLSDPAGEYSGCAYLATVWAILYLIMTVATGVFYAYFTVLSRQAAESGANFTEEAHFNETIPCEKMVIKFNGEKNAKTLNAITIALGLFYAVEVWTRFICCPKKIEFARSRHIVDLVVSIFECSVVIYFLVIRIQLNQLETGKYTDEEDLIRRCAIADKLDTAIVIVEQIRMTRLLNYAAVYGGLKVLLITLYRSWRDIVLLVVLITLAVLLFAPMVYFLSQTDVTKPNSIRDIPTAYWFVLVTMTTVGYGDIYPTELGGYIGTMIVMICGLMVTALPVAIIGGNFTVVYEYNEKYKKLKKKESIRIDSNRPSIDICKVDPMNLEDMV